MRSFSYTVTDPVGIHARPAGLLAKEARRFVCEIKVEKGGARADAKRLIAVMGLAVKCGDEIKLTLDGADEDAAAEALEQFVKEHL